MTLRQQIASGPKFTIAREPSIDDGGGKMRLGSPLILLCGACDYQGYVDGETGICRECFRSWRFSPFVVDPRQESESEKGRRTVELINKVCDAMGMDAPTKVVRFTQPNEARLMIGCAVVECSENARWVEWYGGVARHVCHLHVRKETT